MEKTKIRTYKATYSDRFGTEDAIFQSNGSMLFLKLRGNDFKGTDFESLEGQIDDSKFEYLKFRKSAILTNFTLKINIPILIIVDEKEQRMEFIATVITGEDSIVYLYLETKLGIYQTEKKYGSFEEALVAIQDKFPKNMQIKTCVSCKFSHYSPFGNGMFGGLKCFKNYNNEVDKLNDKADLFELWEKGFQENKIFDTQETFDCPDFKEIKKNDWVYKDWKATS